MNKLADLRLDQVGEYSREVGTQVSGALASLADVLADGLNDWASKARNIARNTDDYVRASPWQTAGVVALAGIAVGYFVSRQTRRNVRGSWNA